MSHHTLFLPIFAAASCFFLICCAKRLLLIRTGRAEERFDLPVTRLAGVLRYALFQKRVLARPFGVNHLVLFWAFLVLLVANCSFILEALFPALSAVTAFPAPLHQALGCAFDLASALALAAALVALVRRFLVRPDYLDSRDVKARSVEAAAILFFIVVLSVAAIGLNAARIAQGAEPASSLPVSALAGHLLQAIGQDPAALADLFWWLHAGVLVSFICLLPLSKHMHILTAIPNCFFRNLTPAPILPREEFRQGESLGAAQVADFSWKDLLDGFSCTECGRCQDACPAARTGKSLNPRQVVHALKANLLQGEASGSIPLIGAEAETSCTEESIWACTTCASCLKQCPVLIEQMPKIIKMRRHLVQMKARFPEELLNLFENMEQRKNPWGIAPSERTKWQGSLEVPPFQAGKTEYLLFVGCAGAFDNRSKQVTQALAVILNQAGVSWGTLGKEEQCCGDSVRRLGNEYLFERMAQENVQLLREKGVTKVVTQCPHCFTTLKNDYRQYGLELEVLHHSELIGQLLLSDRLKLKRQVTGVGRTLFHDSCYLGRHNGQYQAPRRVIAEATGTAAYEFDRHRENAFCCGAGGGRMWLEEHEGERINAARIQEALTQNPDTICVSCPYCMTMFEDALKDCGAEGVKVRDIAELAAEGVAG